MHIKKINKRQITKTKNQKDKGSLKFITVIDFHNIL